MAGSKLSKACGERHRTPIALNGQLTIAVSIPKMAVQESDRPLLNFDQTVGRVFGPSIRAGNKGNNLAGASIKLGLVAVRLACKEIVKSDPHPRGEPGRLNLVGHRSSPPFVESDPHNVHRNHLSNHLFHLDKTEMSIFGRTALHEAQNG